MRFRIANHRRFTANHTWHVDRAGRHLFVKANPHRDEARRERVGHAAIRRHYPVPALLGARQLGPWTLIAYERWPHLGTDRGLLLDEITHADRSGDLGRLDACLTDLFQHYHSALRQTVRQTRLGDTVTKLYGDRAARGGRVDQYYHGTLPWPLREFGARLIVNGREHTLHLDEVIGRVRHYFQPDRREWAATTQGDPTDFNLGWSPPGGPVWFDYDTGGLNSMPGEFACFLLYQRLHGAWLTPRYNRAAYRDHPSALAPEHPPRVRVSSTGDTVEIRFRLQPSPARRHVLRRYLAELVHPCAQQLGVNDVMEWLRPYLAMRLLGVYNVNDLTRADAAVSVGLLCELLDPATTLIQFLDLEAAATADRT